MRQFALPIFGQLALGCDLVDVSSQGERDDLRIQPFNHRAGLRARSAMRCLDFRRDIALPHPIVDESLVDIIVKFARGIVANV